MISDKGAGSGIPRRAVDRAVVTAMSAENEAVSARKSVRLRVRLFVL